MTPIKNNFWRLLQEKELKLGRRISFSEIERETGITRKTLYAWRDNRISRVNTNTVEALCKFLECDLGDLIVLEKDP